MAGARGFDAASLIVCRLTRHTARRGGLDLSNEGHMARINIVHTTEYTYRNPVGLLRHR